MISKILRMPDKAAEMNPEAAVLSAIQGSNVAKKADCGKGRSVTALPSPEKQRRLAVRQRIRTALMSVPKERKLTELVAAIEEEMYLEWGQEEPVTIANYTGVATATEKSASLRRPARA
jgi:hypothetical protein